MWISTYKSSFLRFARTDHLAPAVPGDSGDAGPRLLRSPIRPRCMRTAPIRRSRMVRFEMLGASMECEIGRKARIEVRVTVAEAERIRARAAALGLSVSAHIRRAALADGPVTLVADAGALADVYVELRRSGNNVNQVARALNTYGSGGVPDAVVAAALSGVERATEAVAEELARAKG